MGACCGADQKSDAVAENSGHDSLKQSKQQYEAGHVSANQSKQLYEAVHVSAKQSKQQFKPSDVLPSKASVAASCITVRSNSPQSAVRFSEDKSLMFNIDSGVHINIFTPKSDVDIKIPSNVKIPSSAHEIDSWSLPEAFTPVMSDVGKQNVSSGKHSMDGDFLERRFTGNRTGVDVRNGNMLGSHSQVLFNSSPYPSTLCPSTLSKIGSLSGIRDNNSSSGFCMNIESSNEPLNADEEEAHAHQNTDMQRSSHETFSNDVEENNLIEGDYQNTNNLDRYLADEQSYDDNLHVSVNSLSQDDVFCVKGNSPEKITFSPSPMDGENFLINSVERNTLFDSSTAEPPPLQESIPLDRLDYQSSEDLDNVLNITKSVSSELIIVNSDFEPPKTDTVSSDKENKKSSFVVTLDEHKMPSEKSSKVRGRSVDDESGKKDEQTVIPFQETESSSDQIYFGDDVKRKKSVQTSFGRDFNEGDRAYINDDQSSSDPLKFNESGTHDLEVLTANKNNMIVSLFADDSSSEIHIGA